MSNKFRVRIAVLETLLKTHCTDIQTGTKKTDSKIYL